MSMMVSAPSRGDIEVVNTSLRTGLVVLLALAAAVPAAAGGDGIYLESRTIHPSDETGSLPAADDQRRHVVLQFTDIPDDDRKDELRDEYGLTLLSYLPEKAWYASAPGDSLDELKKEPDVTYLTAPATQDKIADSVKQDTEDSTGTETTVAVEFFSDVDSGTVERIAHQYGTDVSQVGDTRVVLTLDRSGSSTLLELASEDAVKRIDEPAPQPEANNANSRELINVDTLQSSPYNLDGSGITAAMWDSGLAGDHRDLTDGDKLITGDSTSITDHATHVAGTMLGGGVIDDENRGMAPASQLVSFQWPSSITELKSETDEALDHGSVVSHNSWGWTISSEDDMGNYDSYSAAYDKIVRGASVAGDLSVVFSAGNEGNDGWNTRYDTLTSTGATSKNTITVGALTDARDMTSFSSWGPTNDGRIKPDVMANGQLVSSTMPGDDYGYKSGSSTAAPAVSGTVLLLHEAFQNEQGSTPAPATVKALLVHTADDIRNNGPDYKSGWGIVDAQEAVDLVTADSSGEHIFRDSLNSDDTQDSYTFNVDTGDKQTFTLVWSDRAADPSASKQLVNDLDLVVRDGDGDRYYPWTLDPSDPSAAASRDAEDHRNTVEQVVVPDAETDTLSVTVKGTLPEPSQEYTLVADTAGNNDSDDGTGDGTKDPVSLNVLSPTATTYETTDIRYSANVSRPVDSMAYSVDGTENRSMANDTATHYYSDAGPDLADGDHTVTFYATDDRTVSSTQQQFAVNTSDDTGNDTVKELDLTLHRPESTTYDQTTDLPLEFTSNTQLQSAWYSVDGGSRVAIDGNTTFGVDSDGEHTLNLYGEDIHGSTDSVQQSFAVDTGGSDDDGNGDAVPDIMVRSPDAGTTYSEKELWFNITTDTAAEYARLTLNRDESYYLESDQDWERFYKKLEADEGLNSVLFITGDGDGNYDTASATFRVNGDDDGGDDGGSGDTTPPALTLHSPSSVTYDRTTDLPLEYTAGDDAASVWYTVNGGAKVDSDGNTTFRVDSDGNHTVTLYASDTNGNVAERSQTFTVATDSGDDDSGDDDGGDGGDGDDTTSPAVTFEHPVSGEKYTGDELWFNVTTDEPVETLRLTVNQETSYSLESSDGQQFATKVPVEKGLNTANVIATDPAGNYQLESVTFTMDG